MLQSVATLISLFIAAGMIAVIAGVLADDWVKIMHALGLHAPIESASPVRARPPGDRRARVVRVRSQSAPLRAAA